MKSLRYHIIFWIIYWLAQSLLMSEGKSLGFYLTKNVAMVSLQAMVVYFNLFVLLPKLYNRKFIYVSLAVMLIYLVYVVSYQWIELVQKFFKWIHLSDQTLDFPPIQWKVPFWIFLSGSSPYSLALVCSALYYVSQQNNRNKRKTLELEVEQLKTEMLYLRSQINPHFLFNSLNNIHSLILNDTIKAESYVLQLGDLLRHMLYEVRKESTELEEEIKAVKNFIELIQLRTDNKIALSIQVENWKAPIAPLLLCTIMENGIKHSGIEHDPKALLSIKIEEKNQVLEMEMDNSIHKKRQDINRSGLGLSNIQKRLEYHYPGHHFDLAIHEDQAKTTLKINLDQR